MAETKTKSVFQTLNDINVNGHTEQKNGLTYLAWAWAWAEVKKAYPNAFYTIYESPEGLPYFTDGRTCWVKTGVTIEGLEHIEYLPIMDFRNQSITLEKVTSMDMNKTIQRSLTKACARHGLGLYVYAGEDLPEVEKKEVEEKEAAKSAKMQAELQEAFDILKPEIDTAPSRDYLTKLYKDNPALQGYQPFIDALSKRKKEVAA